LLLLRLGYLLLWRLERGLERLESCIKLLLRRLILNGRVCLRVSQVYLESWFG